MHFLINRFFGERLSRACLMASLAMVLMLVSPVSRAEEVNAEGGDGVVARVNGTEIRFSDLLLAEEESGEVLASVPEDVRFEYLLSLLIDRVIVSNQARDKGLLDDPAVQRRIAFYENKALRDVYWTQMLAARITDEAAQAFYDEQAASVEPREEIRARHILVATQEDAQAIVDELAAGGDFEALAREKSTGPSGAEGGDLGYFSPGTMVEAFNDAAFALQTGDISAPVKTKFGWHVIKIEDRRLQEVPAFDLVRDQVVSALAQDEGRKLMDELREAAVIEIVGADGASSRPVIAPPE